MGHVVMGGTSAPSRLSPSMTFHLWSFLPTRGHSQHTIPRTRTNQRACCDFLQESSSSAAGHLQSDKMKTV